MIFPLVQHIIASIFSLDQINPINPMWKSMQHIQFVWARTIDHTQVLILKLMLNSKIIALHGEGGGPPGLDP